MKRISVTLLLVSSFALQAAASDAVGRALRKAAGNHVVGTNEPRGELLKSIKLEKPLVVYNTCQKNDKYGCALHCSHTTSEVLDESGTVLVVAHCFNRASESPEWPFATMKTEEYNELLRSFAAASKKSPITDELPNELTAKRETSSMCGAIEYLQVQQALKELHKKRRARTT